MSTHWMDQIGIAITGKPRLYEPVFSEGWGDRELLASFEAPSRRPPLPVPLALETRITSETEDRRVTELRFASPGEGLPSSAQTGHALLIEPRNARRLAIGFASFNEHGYSTRSAIVRPLFDSGTAVVLLENPYYGQRRPHPEQQPMRTVADLLVMGAAAVWEGKSLATYFEPLGSWSIGFFGYSMGGNIAALAAATSPFPVACAALAASHSPGPVFTESALARAVAWEALGGRAAKPKLAATLGSASVLNYEPQPWTSRTVIVAAEGDGYIPEHAVRDLHDHWPGSELRILPGGHASLLKFGKAGLATAIHDAFERFESER